MRSLLYLFALGLSVDAVIGDPKASGAASDIEQVLSLELNTTSFLIKAYQRRLAVLQSLRERVIDGEGCVPEQLLAAAGLT